MRHFNPLVTTLHESSDCSFLEANDAMEGDKLLCYAKGNTADQYDQETQRMVSCVVATLLMENTFVT